jgi:superfamily II DNA or RNA helicase
LQLPTGGGKTVIACELIRKRLEQGLKVVLYTSRRLLREQLSREFKKHGLTHGIRASGYQPEYDEPFQISMIQTESTRSKKAERLQGEYVLHGAHRVIVDEAHVNAASTPPKNGEKWSQSRVRSAVPVRLTRGLTAPSKFRPCPGKRHPPR